MTLKRYQRFHKSTSQKDRFNEQFCDIEEYIIRKCEEAKIDWRMMWSDNGFKIKMAKKFGCYREYTDSMYGRRDAI